MVLATGMSLRNKCSLSWPEEKLQFHKQVFSHMNSPGQEFGQGIVETVSLYSKISETTVGVNQRLEARIIWRYLQLQA